MAKVLPFVTLADHVPKAAELDADQLKPRLVRAVEKESAQLALFA